MLCKTLLGGNPLWRQRRLGLGTILSLTHPCRSAMLRTLGSDHIQQASESHRRATIFSAGRQIPLQRPNHSACRRIPSPRRNHFSGPANPIAAPPSFQRAGESHRRSPQSFQRAGESHRRAAIISVVRQIPLRAAFFSAGRQIPSPRRNHFSRPANPIAAPQSFQQAGESHCRATIFSAIIIQHSVLSFKTHFKFPHLCWISSKQYLYLQDELSPSYPQLQESFQSRNNIPMAKGHWYCPCSHHP